MKSVIFGVKRAVFLHFRYPIVQEADKENKNELEGRKWTGGLYLEGREWTGGRLWLPVNDR